MRLLVALLSLHLLLCLGFAVITAAFLVLLTGERPALTRQTLGWLSREWLGTALLIAIRPLGWPRRGPVPSVPAAPGFPAPLFPATQAPAATTSLPVLLVPGYTMNRSCFYFLALYLRRRGWRWVWGVNNRPRSQPVPVFAHHLAARVERLCQAAATEQVDIVAHSMGGLVTAWYVQHLGGDRRVRRVITLGTPWAGSRIAVFGNQREARDLQPGSAVLSALSAPTVPWTSIWSPQDNIVLPPESAICPGAENVAVEWVGHNSLLLSARVYRLVADALTAPPDGPAARLSGEAPPPAGR